jgi:hypothetical protein
MSGKGKAPPSTKIIKPKTKAGIRFLEKRAPKIVSLYLLMNPLFQYPHSVGAYLLTFHNFFLIFSG